MSKNLNKTISGENSFVSAIIETTSETSFQKQLAGPTEAIIIMQLESTGLSYEKLEDELCLKEDHPFRRYFYLKQAYVHGRKCRIIAIDLRYGDFTSFFSGISIMSINSAYFSGKTITDIDGPSAGVIEKIHLFYYIENKNDYTLYAGELFNTFFFFFK